VGSRDILDALGCQDCQNQSTPSITVVDPFHPLFGRTFPIAFQHRSPREPRSFEVEHRDGIVIRIAAAATDRSYCPSHLPRTRIRAPAIRRLLSLLAEWREPCESRHVPSGSASRTRSAKPSGMLS